MGDLAKGFCADIVLLDVCCAQLTETPIAPPGEVGMDDALKAVRTTANLVDDLLVPAVRDLHQGLSAHAARLSELLELLPYLQTPGPVSASQQIQTTLENALHGDHTAQSSLREVKADLRRAALGVRTTGFRSATPETQKRLGDYRAELLACSAEPQRKSRLRVSWTFERSPDGGRCHHPRLSLLPSTIAPFVSPRSGAADVEYPRVPARWVSEVLNSLQQTLAWLHRDVDALEAAWISSAAELKASVAAIDWSPSDRLRAQTQLLQQLDEAHRSLDACARTFRWLLHFDVVALIHPLPASADR